LLKIIEQNQDEIVTAANVVNNIRDAKTFVVPKNIDDNSLLALKTAGLISGHGRSVTLTDRGRVALRDAYLKDPVNEFRKARKKDKFDLNAAKEVKVANKKSKFTKT
jgi:superfamily II helicase